jgi:hypothetical protein
MSNCNYRPRLPKVGELVEYHSIFEEDRLRGIVISVPSQEEIDRAWLNLSPESTRDPDVFFTVMTETSEVESWTEWEWNYIDNEDGKKE